MTVSNVVNGRSGTVGAETRMRVESAISELGYRPNAAARALKLSKSRTIGLIVLNESYNILADPFIADLADGLCAGVNEQGYSFLVQGLRPEDLERPLESLKMQCDGLCLLLSGASALRINMLTLLRQLKQPIVLFQQSLPEQIDDICLLRQDDFEGGRLIASYLLGRGARRLLMLVPALEWPAMVARLEGVRQAVALCPDAELEVLHTEGEKADAVKDSLGRHLESNALPDAIMAGNDQMAIATHELLIKAGTAVPDQVRLTGFNAFSFGTISTRPLRRSNRRSNGWAHWPRRSWSNGWRPAVSIGARWSCR